MFIQLTQNRLYFGICLVFNSCVWRNTSWIFMPCCDWILSMKWNTALLETYLPRDTNQKSTYCSVHADRRALGLNLQATFVQVRRFKLISVKSRMVSAVTETLLWFCILLWQYFEKTLTVVPSFDQNLLVLQIHGNHLDFRAHRTGAAHRHYELLHSFSQIH